MTDDSGEARLSASKLPISRWPQHSCSQNHCPLWYSYLPNKSFSLANRTFQLTNNCNKISSKHHHKKAKSVVCFHSLKTLYIFDHETKHLIFCKRYPLSANHCLVDRSLANYFSETNEHSFVLHADTNLDADFIKVSTAVQLLHDKDDSSLGT